MGTFDKFAAHFGAVESSRPVSDAVLKKYKKRLPAEFLDLLAEQGSGGYAGGLFWTVSPDSLGDLLDDWLEEPAKAAVFARTAFGELFLWQEGAAWYLNVQKGSVTKVVSSMELFFNGFLLDSNIEKKVFRRPLFGKALKKLGALADDEVYAFTPALALGGSQDADSLKKAKLREYLGVLSELV